MAVLHNLFPPIFPQKIPYFTNADDYETGTKVRWYVHFDIGDLNKIEDIKAVNGTDEQNDQDGLMGYYCQISLIDSRTNSPVLLYDTNSIRLAVPILNRVFRAGGGSDNYDANYPYYITLDHLTNSCILDQLDENVEYKLQMRFLSKDITMPSEEATTGSSTIYTESGYMEWLDYSNSYASEWSKVAIIKRIRNRRLRILDNKKLQWHDGNMKYSHDPFFWFCGILDFRNPNDADTNTELKFPNSGEFKLMILRASAENNYTQWEKYYLPSYGTQRGNFNPLSYTDEVLPHGEMRENIDRYIITLYDYQDWQDQGIENAIPLFSSGQIKPPKYNLNLIDYQIPMSFPYGTSGYMKFHYIIKIITTSGKIKIVEDNIGYIPRLITEHYITSEGTSTLSQDPYEGIDSIEYNSRDYINLDSQYSYVYIIPDKPHIIQSDNITNINQLFSLSEFNVQDYPLEGGKRLIQEDYTVDVLDLSLKNGSWYKYMLLKLSINNENYYQMDFSPLTSPTMFDFEDIILIDKEYNPLKIKLNPNISSYKYNLNQIQQTTLGNQFPFIRRNGKQFYRTFSISGLISSYMDDELGTSINGTESVFHDGDIGTIHDSMQRENGEDILPTLDLRFGSKEDLFQKEWQQYQRYEQSRPDITNRINFLYERKFRERVIDFLYNKHAKLLKSPTEGNIIVRLQDVNFTPNQSLSRGVYEFSATAIEVDKASLQNCDKIEAIKIVSQEDEG